MALLGLNIDHVATVRQARRGAEPDPVAAARIAVGAGADCITAHLREDRRHVQDSDIERIRAEVPAKFNLEMAATAEMLAIAERVKPEMATLVPEARREITTEGGLPVIGHEAALRDAVKRLRDAGILASAFIDADPAQIQAAASVGFQVCEVHTGPYAHACARGAGPAEAELARVRDAGALIQRLAMRFNAGHALNYDNARPIADLPGVWELHIGHSVISRALFDGIERATRDMKALIA